MEKRITEAFGQVRMPDQCIEKIEKAMTQPRRSQPVLWRAVTAAAACLALFFLLLSEANIVNAMESLAQQIKSTAASLISPDAKVQKNYKFENGSLTIEDGITADGHPYSNVRYYTGSFPSWLLEDNERLYFTGNDEFTDITDLISEDVPFTFIFTDSYGFRHYIAVGGTYGVGETALDQLGWSEWIQEAPYDDYSWLGGYANGHWDNERECNRVWLEAAKDILGIPFP